MVQAVAGCPAYGGVYSHDYRHYDPHWPTLARRPSINERGHEQLKPLLLLGAGSSRGGWRGCRHAARPGACRTHRARSTLLVVLVVARRLELGGVC